LLRDRQAFAVADLPRRLFRPNKRSPSRVRRTLSSGAIRGRYFSTE
jgi:hypothetical protein